MTRFGPLDVLGKIGTGHAAAGRGYDELVPESALLAVGTLRVQVLGLRALIRSKKEAGRDKDRAVLAILQRAPTNILQSFVAATDLIVAESRVAVALRYLLQFPMVRRAAASPRVATGRVVNGKIVTRAKFPEGTKLVLQVDTPAPVAAIDESDAEAIGLALNSIRQGEGVSLDKVRAILRRL